MRKALSPAFGNRQKRRAQLVRALKQRRRYPSPVRGGTGKHRRRTRFAKHPGPGGSPIHSTGTGQEIHGRKGAEEGNRPASTPSGQEPEVGITLDLDAQVRRWAKVADASERRKLAEMIVDYIESDAVSDSDHLAGEVYGWAKDLAKGKERWVGLYEQDWIVGWLEKHFPDLIDRLPVRESAPEWFRRKALERAFRIYSVEEIRMALKEAVEGVRNSKPFIRVPREIAEGLIEDSGGFRNAIYRVGGEVTDEKVAEVIGHGAEYVIYRAIVESWLFGYGSPADDPEFTVKDRFRSGKDEVPVYGYLGPNGDPLFLDTRSLDGYGEVAFEIDKSLMDSATISFGDSFDSGSGFDFLVEPHSFPSPADDLLPAILTKVKRLADKEQYPEGFAGVAIKPYIEVQFHSPVPDEAIVGVHIKARRLAPREKPRTGFPPDPDDNLHPFDRDWVSMVDRLSSVYEVPVTVHFYNKPVTYSREDGSVDKLKDRLERDIKERM